MQNVSNVFDASEAVLNLSLAFLRSQSTPKEAGTTIFVFEIVEIQQFNHSESVILVAANQFFSRSLSQTQILTLQL